MSNKNNRAQALNKQEPKEPVKVEDDVKTESVEPVPSDVQNEEVSQEDNQETEESVVQESKPVETAPTPAPEPQPEPVQKPKVGFASINKKLESQTVQPALHKSPKEVHEILKAKFGVDVADKSTPLVIQSIITDMDDYAAKMGPRSPVTPDDSRRYQEKLVRRINDCLSSELSTGIVGLQIIEEYFRQYSRGAFGGILPFRSFNEMPTHLQAFADIVFAIQSIVIEGSIKGISGIGIEKLKQASPTSDGQLVLLGYINSHEK